jgi:hypothetical protein
LLEKRKSSILSGRIQQTLLYIQEQLKEEDVLLLSRWERKP